MSDLRYPIGPLNMEPEINSENVEIWIHEIEATPVKLREAITGLNDLQLDTPYRPKGWTVRQVVHHLADSHMNSYVRFKLALTEDNPSVRGYDERAWAELPEAKSGPIDFSLDLLEAIHRRWVIVLRNLTVEQLDRTFQHSELGPVKLSINVNLYAWHGKHHVAHITALREREGW
ncbi:bacillithiol transferase BstA [bacterium AH-315-P07]|nr:bacillithiol transferase BstA [bacterium AH-315-P07]